MQRDRIDRDRRMKNRVVLVLLLVLVAVFFALTIVRMERQSHPAPHPGSQAPTEGTGLAAALGTVLGSNIELIDHDGRAVRTADFDGKVKLVFFGFTHCPDVCPTGLSLMSLLLEELGDEAAQVRALFISVDPERDTPEVMKGYVSNFANGIIGLTGSTAQVEAAVRAFHAYARKVPQGDGSYTVDHTASLYLLDRSGGFRATIDIHENQKTALEKLRLAIRRPT